VQITSGMGQPSSVMAHRPLTRRTPGRVSDRVPTKWRADSCSRKRDNEPHRDHGVQAGNGKAEPNLGHGALGALRPKVYPPALHALLRATNVTKIRMRERRNRSVHKAYQLHVTRSSPCHKGARSRPADWSNGTVPWPSRPPIGRTLAPRSKRKVSGRFRLHASAAAPSEGPLARCRCSPRGRPRRVRSMVPPNGSLWRACAALCLTMAGLPGLRWNAIAVRPAPAFRLPIFGGRETITRSA